MTWQVNDPVPDLTQMREWLRNDEKVDWAELIAAFCREGRKLEEHFATYVIPVGCGGIWRILNKSVLLGDIETCRSILSDMQPPLHDIYYLIGVAWAVRQPEIGEYLESVSQTIETFESIQEQKDKV